MKNTTTVRVALGDQTMTFETGLLARQAAGQATCQLGETPSFNPYRPPIKHRFSISKLRLPAKFSTSADVLPRFNVVPFGLPIIRTGFPGVPESNTPMLTVTFVV